MAKVARIVGVLLVVGGLGLGLVACGGDDDDDSASAGAGTTLSDRDVENAADAAGVDKECIEGVQAYAALGASAGAAFSGSGTELEKSIDAFQAWAKAAPGDIRDEMQVIADAYGTYYAAIQDSGWDPSSGTPPTEEQAQAMQAAGEALDDSAVQDAGDRVSAWFDEHCTPGS